MLADAMQPHELIRTGQAAEKSREGRTDEKRASSCTSITGRFCSLTHVLVVTPTTPQNPIPLN